MARPLLDIDAEQVEKLAALHCTTEEIAEFFGCHKDTITGRFSAELAKGRAGGRISLRRMQWQTAKKGNCTMQIWLGKQYLGQRDWKAEEIEEAVRKEINHQSQITNGQLLELVKVASGGK